MTSGEERDSSVCPRSLSIPGGVGATCLSMEDTQNSGSPSPAPLTITASSGNHWGLWGNPAFVHQGWALSGVSDRRVLRCSLCSPKSLSIWGYCCVGDGEHRGGKARVGETPPIFPTTECGAPAQLALLGVQSPEPYVRRAVVG